MLLGGSVPAHGQESLRSAAARLKAAVTAEEARIADTREGLADAERRLAVLDARARKRRQQLDDTQDKLVARARPADAAGEKQAQAEKTLAENLRHNYMDGEPTFATVVLNADGFTDLVERFEFLRRIARRNASVLGDTRDARIKVKGMTADLKDAAHDLQRLAREADDDRNRADAIRTALLNREQDQLRKRNGTAARLASVRGRIAAIERRQARRRAARDDGRLGRPTRRRASAATPAAAAAAAGTSSRAWSRPPTRSPPRPTSGAAATAAPPAATTAPARSPTRSPPAACSTARSTSAGFMSWGDAGPGRRITVYANAGHAFMVVDGRRYDTSALSGGGTRWTSAMRSTAGFVARHPPGL